MDVTDVLGGRYRLLERLGEGGMSVIWRARDQVLGRDVAVKVLSAQFAADPSSRQRIRAEAQAVAKLSHPNVAGVFDYGEADLAGGERVPYIVMELVTGPTLTELIEDEPMPLHWVLRVGAEVAAALAAAHEQDIVHRDVKPANVMVTAGGMVKVVDFGVAAVIGDLSETDAVLFGTPAYVAPERLQGGPVAAGTDMYGLGLLMYRMLAGHMPWPAESTTEMLVAHIHLDPDPLPPLTGLPGDVIGIIAECLAKEPADRPAAADVARILVAAAAVHMAPPGGAAGAASGRGGRGVARPRTKATTDARRRRRGRRLATAGAAVLVIAAAVVAAASGGPGGTQRAGSAPISSSGGATGATVTAPPVDGAGTTEPAGGGMTAEPGAAPGAVPGGLAPNEVDPRQAGAPPDNGGATAAGTDPTAAPTTDQPPPAAQVRSASEAGNSVTVRCVGATATIIGAAPAAGYSITRINAGPAEQVNVKFESASATPNRVTFKSRCHDGVPRINPDTA